MPLKPHPTDPDKMVFVRHQYDLPTKREWVGLTDEEIESVYMNTMNFQQNAKALETKLKEKKHLTNPKCDIV